MTSKIAASDRFAQLAPPLFVLLWSTGFIGAKFGLPYAEPLTFLAYRYAIVSAVLILLIIGLRLPLPRRPRMWLHLVFSGLLLHGFYIAGVFLAIRHGMSSGISALIVGVQPLLTATVSGPFLGERVTSRQFMGFGLGFLGLSLTVSKTLAQGQLPLFGFVSCVVALLAITAGTVYQKRYVIGVDLRVGACIQFIPTAIAFYVLSHFFESGVVNWHPRFIFALIWLCLALSLGAISLLWLLIQRGAAAQVASLFYLVPPVTALEGFALFGETLTSFQMVGIAITAVGVALINRR